jgi:alkylhydroperoxidase family enzyme
VEGLHRSGADSELLVALQSDLGKAKLDAKERALLRLGERLTLEPASSSEAVRAAVASGWTNEQVADAIFVISLFNMLTRIADSFALPPDGEHPFSQNAKLPMLRCVDASPN